MQVYSEAKARILKLKLAAKARAKISWFCKTRQRNVRSFKIQHPLENQQFANENLSGTVRDNDV